MGYDVKYEEMGNAREAMISQMKEWETELGNIKKAVQRMINMKDMSGAAAIQIRGYLGDVHLQLIEWLTNTITMYRSLLILYQDWYYQLETDMCARMSQSCMEELEQKLIEGRTTFSVTAEAIHQIERELSPYMDAGSFYSRGVDGAYESSQNTVTTLKTAIGEYEEYHKNNDFSYTNEMLESMGRIIQGQLRGSGANIQNYQPGSLKQTEAYQKAGAISQMQEMYIGLVKEEVEASEANYVERKEAWEEELRKRKEQELIHIIEGIGIMIVGTYVTITTMGAGLPMVVTAAEVILGSTATVYGASNNMEALSNLYQAMGGDARSTVFNPIRDTIFASNPELYYKIGNTATMLTVLSLPVGMSMEAAVAVGGSPLRAGITEIGKFGISTMAGEVTTDKVTEWTGSEALGIIAGMGTSSLSYGGLSAVDYKVNISGLHGTGGNTQIGNVTGSGKGGSGSIGEGIESGRTTKPNQVHHYATNKSKTYTPQLEEIANRYGLDLDDAWNKDLLPHQGRHPNAYHEYVLDSMKQFDNIAQGDKDIFLKLFDNLKNNVKSNPDMLYKEYWK